MRRMPCVAAAALAFLLSAAPAEARTPVFARTKCVGLYCRIVTEPAPPRPQAPDQAMRARRLRSGRRAGDHAAPPIAPLGRSPAPGANDRAPAAVVRSEARRRMLRLRLHQGCAPRIAHARAMSRLL